MWAFFSKTANGRLAITIEDQLGCYEGAHTNKEARSYDTGGISDCELDHGEYVSHGMPHDSTSAS